jgi:hypothetical protein
MATLRVGIPAAFIGSLIAGTVPATASDGILEINQACAVNTGCFAGDAASFPVTITQPGSYRLTGNLDLTSTPNTDAIVLQATVTLDLGGFSIQGPITCTGAGPTLSCGAGTGSGVLFDPSAQASVVRNGTVQGMGETGVGGDAHQIQIESIRAVNNGRDGVSAQGDTIIRQCTAFANGEDGVDVDAGSLVESTVAVGNGDDGVETDGPSTIVRGVTARGNGADGIHTEVASLVDTSNASENGDDGISVGRGSTVSRSAARANTAAGIKAEGDVTVSESSSRDNVREGYWLAGPAVRFTGNVSSNNTLADACGGGICSERRRFYQTSTTHAANAVLTACAAGFHMASLWEIIDRSGLAYDTVLGVTNDDSGEGPPAIVEFSWIRTGYNAWGSSMGPGIANCTAWTSTSAARWGTAVSITDWSDPPETIGDWKADDFDCSGTRRTWCVEDD